jgi:hypothetical protein
MRYIDPSPVECPNCGETREYPIEDLRNSRATCLVCHHDFSSIGREMREREAYWAYILIDLVGFIIDLQDRLNPNIEYEDKEVENLKTLDDIFRLTLTKLPPDYNADQLKQIIFELASEAGNYTVNQLSMEMNLREVLEKR